MTPLDQFALGRLNDLIRKTTAAYESYEFYKVYHSLNTFFTVELSAGYLDMMKDRLYTWNKNAVERRSSQTALHILLHHLVRIMAPITSFLSEETLAHLPWPSTETKPESALLLEFPTPNTEWDNAALASDLEVMYAIRSEVSKALELLRQNKTIGSGLDAKLNLTADGPKMEILKRYERLLPEFFIVSQVALKVGGYAIETLKAGRPKVRKVLVFQHRDRNRSTFP